MLVTFGRVVRKITLRRIRASQCEIYQIKSKLIIEQTYQMIRTLVSLLSDSLKKKMSSSSVHEITVMSDAPQAFMITMDF